MSNLTRFAMVVGAGLLAATGALADECRNFDLAVRAVAEPKYSLETPTVIKGSDLKDFSTCTAERGNGPNVVFCKSAESLTTSNVLARLQQCVGFDHSLLVVQPGQSGGAYYSSLLLENGLVVTSDQYFGANDLRQRHVLVVFKPDAPYFRSVKDGVLGDLEFRGIVVAKP